MVILYSRNRNARARSGAVAAHCVLQRETQGKPIGAWAMDKAPRSCLWLLPRVACGVVTGKREPRKSAAKYVQHKGVGLDAAPSQLPPEGPLWA